MENSILLSVKSDIGPYESCEEFDNTLLSLINSTFAILQQMGVGPVSGFRIVDSESMWDEFIPNENPQQQLARDYMSAKVKMAFDPPQGGPMIEVLRQHISELEWRLANPVSTEVV